MAASVKKPLRRRNITGKNIHRLRTAANPRITQEDMAGRLARLGVPLIQSQIAKIEIGERPILDYELAAIARVLKVPVQTLFE